MHIYSPVAYQPNRVFTYPGAMPHPQADPKGYRSRHIWYHRQTEPPYEGILTWSDIHTAREHEARHKHYSNPAVWRPSYFADVIFVNNQRELFCIQWDDNFHSPKPILTLFWLVHTKEGGERECITKSEYQQCLHTAPAIPDASIDRYTVYKSYLPDNYSHDIRDLSEIE